MEIVMSVLDEFLNMLSAKDADPDARKDDGTSASTRLCYSDENLLQQRDHLINSVLRL